MQLHGGEELLGLGFCAAWTRGLCVISGGEGEMRGWQWVCMRACVGTVLEGIANALGDGIEDMCAWRA